MSHPREILGRAQRQRGLRDLPAAPLTPAPVAPTAQRASATPPSPQPVPRPVGGHALYSELMRSHDRMGTRHLKG